MNFLKSNRLLTVGFGLVVTGVAAQSAFGFSTWSISLVGVANRDYGGFIGSLDYANTSGTNPISASVNTSFSGLDGNNTMQTMDFVASNAAQANFGQLHLYSDASVTNSYYNASNPYYYNSNTNDFNTNGSPDSLVSLGFAGFNDTLHFGGQLQAGYKARYLFHVDGTNSGYGAAADLAVNIAGHDESFFDFDPGSIDTIWATQAYDIDGVTPQEINVQFSNQVVVNTYDLTDGSNVSGISDFSSTLTLEGIEVLDEFGNRVSGWTLTSDSGTVYNGIGSVPEPGSIVAIAVGAIGFITRRRKKA